MELDVKEFYEGDAHHGTWDMVLLILAIVSFCHMMVIINMKLTMEILVVAFVHSLVRRGHYRKLRRQVVNVCYCLKYLNLFNEFGIIPLLVSFTLEFLTFIIHNFQSFSFSHSPSNSSKFLLRILLHLFINSTKQEASIQPTLGLFSQFLLTKISFSKFSGCE
jgi:hypothetical protein